MPRELSDSESREYQAYRDLGALEDVQTALRRGKKAQEEAAEKRKALDAATARIADLEARVPKDGEVVLSGDDAAAFTAIKAAGKTLKALDEDLKGYEELKGKDARRDRADGLRAAAKAEGWNEDATVELLEDIPALSALSLHLVDEEVNVGTEVAPDKRKMKVGYVEVEGKRVRLGEYVAENKPVILGSLVPTGNGSAPKEGGKQAPAPYQRGSGAPAKPANRAAEFVAALNKAADAPNALKPAATT